MSTAISPNYLYTPPLSYSSQKSAKKRSFLALSVESAGNHQGFTAGYMRVTFCAALFLFHV
jgi:hypothetical protein